LVLVLSFSLTAAAWDVLGHAYIMEQIKGGAQNASGNEVYGITSPDFVNYLIGTPYYEYLYGQTHTAFMRMWRMAGSGKKGSDAQQLALGFVAHNGVWGADYIAHSSSLVGDPSMGYVVQRAMMLEQGFGAYGVWDQLGLAGDAYYPRRLELCHNIVEYIIDIKVWESDHGIAGRVIAAASGRDASIQSLVKTAFAGQLVAFSQETEEPLNQPAALAMLQTYETAFQQRVVLYASLYAAASDTQGVIHNLSGYLSALANQVFGLETEPAQVEVILGLAYGAGLVPDVMLELGGTVNYVRDQLASHNIAYGPTGHVEALAAPVLRTRPVK